MSLPVSIRSTRAGFTLIELLLAISIFVLVIGSVYASLRAATQALVVGRASMELYQTSRAGLNRMMVDFRKALAPASFPFNDKEEDPGMMDDEYYMQEDEQEQLHVTFKGDTKQVQFVIRQELQKEDGPEMDIREVRYQLDSKSNLVKEIYRSLLEARLAEIMARRLEERSGAEPDRSGGRGRRFVPQANQGYFEKPIVQIICEGVKEVKFAFFDGENWKDSWDSEQIVVNEFCRDLDESELTDEDEEKVGLPKLVRCDVKVGGDVQLSTSTEIPTADLNIVSARASESDFGTAYRSSYNRLERLKNGDRSGSSSRKNHERRSRRR